MQNPTKEEICRTFSMHADFMKEELEILGDTYPVDVQDAFKIVSLLFLNMTSLYLRFRSSLSLFQEIIAREPDLAEPYYKIAALHARRNQISESIAWLQKAVDKGFEDWDLLRIDSNMAAVRNSSYYRELLSRSK